MFFYLIRSLTGAFCLVAKRKLMWMVDPSGTTSSNEAALGKKKTQTTWTRRAARKKKKSRSAALWKKTGGDWLPVGAQARSLSRTWGRTAASGME